jgi:adenosylcobinamide-phosphate synthase
MVRARARLLGAAAGVLVDSLLGEPPARMHPVALFGRFMERLEREAFAKSRSNGAWYALAGACAGMLSGVGLRLAVLGALRRMQSWLFGACPRPAPSGFEEGSADLVETIAEAIATGLAVYVACASKELVAAARRVEGALEKGDLDRARLLVRQLVGRDTDGLDEEGICRAVVESVAENTVDAVVGAAFFGAIGGAPGALCYRAINTMDAMVGHRDERYLLFGWASARADDLAGYLPARLCAMAVAFLRPSRARAVLEGVTVDAPRHPSPNAGVAEAAFARALGVALGGKTSYGGEVEDRPLLGSGRPPGLADIERAAQLLREVTVLLALVLAGLGAPRRARGVADG